MNNLLIKILVGVFFLAFANCLHAQVGLTIRKGKETPLQHGFYKKNQNSNVLFSQKNTQNKVPKDLRNYFLKGSKPQNVGNSILQKNNRTELAFFCRIEVGLEKSSKLPVRFRLGEVQAVDKKEGKWKQFQ